MFAGRADAVAHDDDPALSRDVHVPSVDLCVTRKSKFYPKIDH